MLFKLLLLFVNFSSHWQSFWKEDNYFCFSRNYFFKYIYIYIYIYTYIYILVEARPTTWVAYTYLLLCSVNSKVKLLRASFEKSPTFIAFCKLLLGNAKVEILLISWHFLVFLCMCPSPGLSLTPSFLANERCWGGTYLGQGLFMSNLQFASFQCSSVF